MLKHHQSLPPHKSTRNVHRAANLNLKVLKRIDTDEKRCKSDDGDSSSQFTQNKIPAFASVHRINRHHTGNLKGTNLGDSAMLAGGTTLPVATANAVGYQKDLKLSSAPAVTATMIQRQRLTNYKYHKPKALAHQQNQPQPQPQQFHHHHQQDQQQKPMPMPMPMLEPIPLELENAPRGNERQQKIVRPNKTISMQPQQQSPPTPPQHQHELIHHNRPYVMKMNTNNLNDIYRRNSLNQTTFSMPVQGVQVNQGSIIQQHQQYHQYHQQQLQQQQRNDETVKMKRQHFGVWPQASGIQTTKVQPSKFLVRAMTRLRDDKKIVVPSRNVQQCIPEVHCASTAELRNETFVHLSDSYDEIVDAISAKPLQSSSVSLNHVYETIKEKPLPLPPSPPPPPPPISSSSSSPPPLPVPVPQSSTELPSISMLRRPPPLPPVRYKLHRKSYNSKETDETSRKSIEKFVLPEAPDTGLMRLSSTLKAENRRIIKLNDYNNFQQQQTKIEDEKKSSMYQLSNSNRQQQQQQQHEQAQEQELEQEQERQLARNKTATTVLEKVCREGCRVSINDNINNNYINNADRELVNESMVATTRGNSGDSRIMTTKMLMSMKKQQQQQQQQCKLLECKKNENRLEEANERINVGETLSKAREAVPSRSGLSAQNQNGCKMKMQQKQNRPSALSIVMEEDSREFQATLTPSGERAHFNGAGGTAKLPYRHGKIEVSLETAQAMAAAAYNARAAQKLAQSKSIQPMLPSDMSAKLSTFNGGFCGALQRAPPPIPSGLARRLANKENYGLGKVKVLLRISDTPNENETVANSSNERAQYMSVDKKKRQVTITDQSNAALSANSSAATTPGRSPMVAAPKMFAFDNLFTADDQQMDVCSSALSEVIPAVLEGSDGCFLTIGYPNCGQSQTLLGTVDADNELGAIPCAISWLYKGINERRQRSGARFSVRVSALGVNPTKPDSVAKDLLAAHATDSDDSPGVYLCDDFLGGPTELRAPTAERAALFLDAALTGRTPQGELEPAMIFTLHVYQYSLSRKGGVAGGRSRLHLIDLGGCANRNGGLPLSGIGNILLAILSGHRHPPNKDHPLTPLLKDCLAPLTCHAAIVAHVMHKQAKASLPLNNGAACGTAGDKAGVTINLNGHQSTGSSVGSGADPSSSELSADTVIYIGPIDDATDGEHPPVFLPSLSSGDNRAIMSKVLKGSVVDKQQSSSSPSKTSNTLTKKHSTVKAANLLPQQQDRSSSLKKGTTSSTQSNNTAATLPAFNNNNSNNNNNNSLQSNLPPSVPQAQFLSPTPSVKALNASPLRHVVVPTMCSKASNIPTPKNSPLRRPTVIGAATTHNNEQLEMSINSPKHLLSEECWVDGPRVSRIKVAEARHLLREVNHLKQCETWIDGPKYQSSRSLTAGNLNSTQSPPQGYGFMDSHKKSMIRQWVEYQTSQVFHAASVGSSPTHAYRDPQGQYLRNALHQVTQLKRKSIDNQTDLYALSTKQQQQSQQQQQSESKQQTNSNSNSNALHNSNLELINTTASHVTNAIEATTKYHRNSAQSQSKSQTHVNNDDSDLHSNHFNSLPKVYGQLNGSTAHYLPTTSASDSGRHNAIATPDCDEDQDSGPSEVPPALPLIQPLGSREISHESLHHILTRHISRESLYQQRQSLQPLEGQQKHNRDYQHSSQLSHQTLSPHYSQQNIATSDSCLQVTEEDIARTMSREHPLAALSQCDNMSIISSFHAVGDAFSDCALGVRPSNQFDQLARLREIFTSQLAMAEVTPVFRTSYNLGSSVYSEPAYRFSVGPGSVCSEPPYRPPTPRQLSRNSSHSSLPSLNGIMQIAGMEQYASLRHPDGASDSNIPKVDKEDTIEADEKTALLSRRSSLVKDVEDEADHDNCIGANDALPKLDTTTTVPLSNQSHLQLLPLTTSSEAYDSGHDSSTPRTSKHSGISRRAESGYHSVATARDSDESSLTSGLSKELRAHHHNHHHHHHHHHHITAKKKRPEKGLCTWLMNPFTCTYGETEGETSDF